jgi:hypothetical protein
MRGRYVFLMLTAVLSDPSMAGPPYVTDDPQPTDYKHYEIYAFGSATTTREGSSGAAGIDFNYGAAPDLQLTAVLPSGYDKPSGSSTVSGLSNVELAAKYRFLRQDTAGWDVSIFPRVFLPSASRSVGNRHASLLLPLWMEHDWDDWSTFGGGGCVLNQGGDSRNFCLAGWALTRQVLPKLQLGLEIYHQTPDTRGGRATTGINFGARYDLNEHYHLVASAGPGVENAAATNQYSWYAALLFTY